MITRVTQLELENFAQGIHDLDDADERAPLSVADVRAQELAFVKILRETNKISADEEVPSWADIYQTLLNANVRPRLAAYIAWATMPKRYRYPKTQEELATQILGLTSDRAITTWRKKYPEIDVMVTELQAEAMFEFRPGAFHALGTVASDPSYRANPDRRLFFEMTKDYTPKIKNEIDDGKGVGRKLLDKMRGKSSAELVEFYGPDALTMLKDLEEELEAEEAETSDQNAKGGDDASA